MAFLTQNSNRSEPFPKLPPTLKVQTTLSSAFTTNDDGHLSAIPPPVEGGHHIISGYSNFVLHPEAPEWIAAKTLQPFGLRPTYNKNKTETTVRKTNITHHILNKLKTQNKVKFQLDANLRSQNSLAFPALDTRPPPRNGGYLLFEDGNDHEAYPPTTVLIATTRDDHAFPFLDGQSSTTILRQIREKK
jgi:hypothetical protein